MPHVCTLRYAKVHNEQLIVSGYLVGFKERFYE